MLSFGISAIGRVGPTYYQNVKTLPDYYARLDAGKLPVVRGIELTRDDLLRRSVIQRIACDFSLDTRSIEDSYNVSFKDYLSNELADLERLEQDGLVRMSEDRIAVTPKGRLLVRAVCMVFDRYLREKRERATYSKVV